MKRLVAERIRVDVIRPDISTDEAIEVLEGAIELIRENEKLHLRYFMTLKLEELI